MTRIIDGIDAVVRSGINTEVVTIKQAETLKDMDVVAGKVIEIMDSMGAAAPGGVETTGNIVVGAIL